MKLFEDRTMTCKNCRYKIVFDGFWWTNEFSTFGQTGRLKGYGCGKGRHSPDYRLAQEPTIWEIVRHHFRKWVTHRNYSYYQ